MKELTVAGSRLEARGSVLVLVAVLLEYPGGLLEVFLHTDREMG